MEITHIIRGEEWISSTPKHILLYQFFGWDLPIFAHMPLLRNPDKSKLSKRKNPVWVSWYKNEGYLPEAILNYLATLAWAHPEEKEIFSLDEMIHVFTLESIQTTAPIFNTEKLRWINREDLRKSQKSKVKSQIFEFYDKKYSLEGIEKVLPLVVERMKTLKEFERPLKVAPLKVAIQALQTSDWTHEAMEKAIREASEKVGLKAKDVFMELRVAVTGKTVGPPLLESLEILGREETLQRLSGN